MSQVYSTMKCTIPKELDLNRILLVLKFVLPIGVQVTIESNIECLNPNRRSVKFRIKDNSEMDSDYLTQLLKETLEDYDGVKVV